MMMKSRSTSTLVLLGGCASAIALAAACAAPSARAQTAFQGSPNVVSGSANITQGTAGGTIDTIELNTSETIINWTPNDISGTGAIDFLPDGRTALFRNNPNVSTLTNYTVLNRILPADSSRPVALNGIVQSLIGSNPGGAVWFYAPGGIIAGASSVFNVGSLVLTSNDIDATNGLIDSSTGAIHFQGVSGSASTVEVRAGAQINALASGSYVALVAPRVVQAGTVTVNGSAAYVGAETVDITINSGLFDISISAGTSDGNGVVHSGTTARPDTATSSDPQHVYMVAVPKNNALTMLLSGNAGYSAADGAVQAGSAVVLSAGHDVAGGSIGVRNATATGEAGFSIGAGIWQPDVTGRATGEITVSSNGSPATQFGGNVNLAADRAITLRADQFGAITAGGNVNLTAGLGETGGKIDLLTFGGSGSAANNGMIDVAGMLTLDASGLGDSGLSSPPAIGANVIGGEISLIATGGSISAGSLNAYANSYGSSGTDRSGDSTGGSITLSALGTPGPNGNEAGALNFGSTSLYASAYSFSSFSTPVASGTATGGTINIAANGGSFTASNLYADASASSSDAQGAVGAATGGSVTLSASNAGGLRGSFTLTDCVSSLSCDISANGHAGAGLNGGTGAGGSVLLYASDADFSVVGDLQLQANGIGGGTLDFDGLPGRGGDGLGGNITVENRAGAAGSAALNFEGLFLSVDGTAGNISDGISFNQGDAGNGTGGTINILAAGGSLTATELDASASGRGGAADVNCPTCDGGGSTPFQAGSGQGGSAQFLITGGNASIGALELRAHGTGGEARAADDVGEVSAIAGLGTGGTALLESRGGVLHADTISIDASGGGGSGDSTFQADGVDGATGTGGTARFLMDVGGSGQVVANDGIVVRALGKGGFGASTGSDGPGFYLAGRGGNGAGGTASVTLASGALTTPSLLVSAEGVGGTGGDNGSDGPGGTAGTGTGGVARLSYLNEGHAIDALIVKADGQGGRAGHNGFIFDIDASGNPIYSYGTGPGGAGGAGQGGTADMLIDVDPSFASLTVSADGIGSAGGIGGTSGAGGTGTGGIAALNIGFGATSVSGALRVSASGFGGLGGTGLNGTGGRGGDAFGGSARLGVAGPDSTLDAGDIGVLAEALGGAGGVSGTGQSPGVSGADGGDATGGTALFTVAAGANVISGAALQVSGNATGGAGSIGIAGPAGGAGGAGGQATGGSATLRIDGGRMRLSSALSTPPSYDITAIGQGGAGAAGSDGSNAGLSGGAGGNGGSGTGGTAAFEATDGDFVLGNLSINADGAGGLAGSGGNGPGGASPAGTAGLSAGGTAQLVNGGGNPLAPGSQRSLASLTMTATGTSGGQISFTDNTTAAGGGLGIAGPLTLSSAGTPVAGFTGITVTGASNPVLVGGDADFASEGPLSFVFAGGAGMTVTGALTGYSGTRIGISHSSRVAGSHSLSGNSIHLSTPGDIDLSSGSLVEAVGDLLLFAQGGINGAGSSLIAGGTATLTGTGISVQRILSGGVTLLNARTGDLIVNDMASGPITASGRNVSLGAAGAMTVDDATATGTVTLNAGGLFTLLNGISGGTVSIGSGDIVLGGTAQIAATGLLSFNALSGQQPAVIGGGDATGGYSLSAAELGRVTAADIAVAGAGDVIIRDLTIGTGTLPGTGLFSVSSAGRMRVEGALAMTGRAGQGGLNLTAGQVLEVIAGSGSIDLRDGNGALGGQLTLASPTIYAASLPAIDDVAEAGSIITRELRLAQNDGFTSEEGLLRAGTIQLHATNGIYIQNSGVSTNFADRRGITANSLLILTSGHPEIAINGRLALSAGGFATGQDMIPLVAVDGNYASGSKINGCLIANPRACATPGNVDNHETLDGLLDPSASLARPFQAALVELRDFVEQGYPPLIDEPVTGAGNEDLWESRCEGEQEGVCDGVSGQ